MIYILLSLLLLVIILLTIGLIRYHLALVNLSQQIEDKIHTGSMKRMGVSTFSKDFLHLYQQINHLFQEVEQSRLIMKREKQTLDMAISNIAHDIRTPLTIASGYTQQLLKTENPESESLRKIAHHLNQVSKRLEALLDYRRLMEGAVQPDLSELEVSTFMTQKLLTYYDSFQTAKIDLDLQVEPGLYLLTDSDLLERLLQNLIGNVLKHGKDEARFSLKEVDNHICLEIANLVKQPIRKIENLSQRFYSENLSDTEESSGLGLYITEEFSHLLGAELQLSTDGAWFTVKILF